MVGPLADHARLVLVVDDEPIVLRLMERALAQAGYQVQTASNGLRALELVGSWPVPPSILITDICMDGLNGVELAKVLTSKHPSVHVLLVSGYGPAHTEVVWPFLRKPFSPDALTHAVQQLVGSPPPFGRTRAG